MTNLVGVKRMSSSRVDQPLALHLSAEQIALLYKNAPLAYIVTFINGSILVYIQRAYISPVRLVFWFTLLGLITLGRALLVYRYTHAPSSTTEAYRWGPRYSIGAGLAGLVWGSTAILLFPQNDLSHQVFVAFVLAGMTAAAVGVLSSYWPASLAFVVPALLPLIIRFFFQGGEVQTAMGIMTLLFLGGILIIMRMVNRSILSTLRLNLEKDTLSRQLQRDKEATDQLNVRLQVEIAEHQKTEAILRESEEKYRHTMDAALVGIYVIEKMNFQYVNPMMTQLFGYTSQEMERLSPLDLVMTGHRDSISKLLRQRTDGPGAPLELQCVRKEGSHFEAMVWMRTTVYGGRQVIVGTVVDISARKAAECALQQANATLEQRVKERTAKLEETNAALRDSEERLRLALQASEAGVWEWNLMTDAILWSPENFSLYGCDPGQGPPTPEDWERALHPEDRECLRDTVRAAAAHPEQEYRAEFRVRHPRRGLRWLLSVGRVERAPDGASQRLLGISLDITSRKQMEEALKEADRRKDEFLAMLAHELRNPLAPIRHAVQIFRELGTEDPRLHWARELIDRQVNHLARLVDDLLDVSRL
ncbi:MAG TPA: PAS domain S-box protein, partial [Candidatus Competibacteraceae bacterium]|nr:PAS domain S-box protein [Candidatus Competibacteraceae bacterium]